LKLKPVFMLPVFNPVGCYFQVFKFILYAIIYIILKAAFNVVFNVHRDN